MAEYLYTVEKACALCNKEFTLTKVRSRLLKVKQDTDFCTYYSGINPYYYSIWVCPHCGYAAPDSHFDELTTEQKEKLASFLKTRKVNVDFRGTRTCEQAIATYKLAIYFYELLSSRPSRPSRLGGMYLKLAWLYRESEKQPEEQQALAKAVENYERALSTERLPIGNLTEVALTYLVGDLYRRIGEYEKALPYFNKIISSQQAKMERNIYNLARDVWQEIREQRKQIPGDRQPVAEVN